MAKALIQVPKGTRDIVGEEAQAFRRLERVAETVFERYSFQELRTPIFESADLFSRSLGATSDVVEKEMFVFSDRGDRSFALRPEGTASVVRHFVENKLSVKAGVHRFYYSGPMFRAERPQAGRYRQFWQIGSEHFGDSSPVADAETICMASEILSSFGLSDVQIHVNSLGDAESRQAYRKALLKYLEGKKSILSEESKRRMTQNPLRVLDSKEDGPKLKDPPLILEYLSQASKGHYNQVKNLIKVASFPVVENPRLVRGLDYYSETVFEFVSKGLGAQNAVAAGGRYDSLVQELGGPAIPAVGFALGMDRVVSAVQAQKAPKSNNKGQKMAFLAPLTPQAIEPAFRLSHELRQAGVAVPPIMLKKKVKNILSSAVDIGANWAILIGEDELARKEATIKNLETREQVSVPWDRVIQKITA